MTQINPLSRPQPSHILLDGKRVDLSICVSADDVAGYVETLVVKEHDGQRIVQCGPDLQPITVKHHGVVRFVYAVQLH